MKKKLFLASLAFVMASAALAQKSDGTTKSLVNAEKEFAQAIAKEGEKSAYIDFASSNGLIYRPNPTNIKSFFSKQSANDKQISWTPTFARVSRSGDLGFTTGPYEKGNPGKYGQYLTVWKAENGTWKVLLDLQTQSNKPLAKIVTQYVEPKDHFVPKFINEKEIKAGREIIITTEKTLNTTLKTYGINAFAGFLTENTRFIFPGYEVVMGKDKVLAYMNSMFDKVNLRNTGVEKALGGDIAYSTGVATIDYKADLRESFHYVFIYERGADHTWNILTSIFVPAER